MSVNSQTVIQYWKLIKHHRMEIWLSPEDPWQMVFFSNFIKVECQALRAPGLAIASIILTVSQSPFGTKTTHLRHCFCIEKPANIYIYIYILFLNQRPGIQRPPPTQVCPLYPSGHEQLKRMPDRIMVVPWTPWSAPSLAIYLGTPQWFNSWNLKPWSVHQVWYVDWRDPRIINL